MSVKASLPVTIARGLVIFAAIAAGFQPAFAQRLLGLDISAWQGNMSQTTWNNIRNLESRQFVFVRSSRGGTTGFYDQNDADNSNGNNTLSQRYDDPYFIQNITRATTAGIYAGPYHFSRPDIVEGTLNSGGVRNSGADEADHFIQMAGPWMRPGYLVPIHDLEAGDGIRTDNELAQFSVDFSNRIYQRMGIRPGIYINGNYTANILQTASVSLRDQLAKPAANRPSVVAPCYPVLWVARWPNQANPNAINVQDTNPKDTYAGFYGPWDDYGDPNPWTFWQYASTGRLQSFNNGANNLDFDVARGDVEFLKDQLVPAVWMNDSSGEWSTLANWNSGQTPVMPVPGAGQVAPIGTLTLPIPRLPGASGASVTSGRNDTVILERTNANIIVTLSSGAHNIRKLYMREALNIIGGSLTINYDPTYASNPNFPNAARSGPISAQFSGPVTLTASGALNVHTLQVEATRTFTLGGGTLVFDTISLVRGTSPAKIGVNGSIRLSPLAGETATIAATGIGNSGTVDLSLGDRSLTIANGPSEVDLSIDVPIANGALTKTGPGTLRLTASNPYTAGTTITEGTLLVNNATGSGTGSGAVNVNSGTLGGTGTISGLVAVNGDGVIAPGTAATIGSLTVNTPPGLGGTTVIKINRNAGAPLSDKLILMPGTLQYSGALFVTNIGAPLVGGEVFTNFSASAYSGTFGTFVLPPLNPGLKWYTENLSINGTIAVNRSPISNPITITNFPPNVLEIPIGRLLANVTDADGDPITLASVELTTTNGITLLTNGTHLYYSNYVNVPDKFSYVVMDGRGGSAIGTVYITNSAAARFASAPVLNANGVALSFVGRPGSAYYLERSTNLLSWLTISTNVAPSSGLFDFLDPNPPYPAAYYKLQSAP
jgi:autotransporter-associated beta strand protein